MVNLETRQLYAEVKRGKISHIHRHYVTSGAHPVDNA